MAVLNRNIRVRHNALVNALVVVANSDRIGTGYAANPQPPAPLSWSLSELRRLHQEQPEPMLADLPSIRAGRSDVLAKLGSHNHMGVKPVVKMTGRMTRTPCGANLGFTTRGAV